MCMWSNGVHQLEFQAYEWQTKAGVFTAYFTNRYIPRCKLTLNYSLYKVAYLTGICLVSLIVKFVLMV